MPFGRAANHAPGYHMGHHEQGGAGEQGQVQTRLVPWPVVSVWLALLQCHRYHIMVSVTGATLRIDKNCLSHLKIIHKNCSHVL